MCSRQLIKIKVFTLTYFIIYPVFPTTLDHHQGRLDDFDKIFVKYFITIIFRLSFVFWCCWILQLWSPKSWSSRHVLNVSFFVKFYFIYIATITVFSTVNVVSNTFSDQLSWELNWGTYELTNSLYSRCTCTMTQTIYSLFKNNIVLPTIFNNNFWGNKITDFVLKNKLKNVSWSFI